MRKRLKRIRKTEITKNEIAADIIFFCISAFLSFIFVFFFDIHHSFYEWPPNLKFIFGSPKPYLFLVPLGTIIGFIVIKLLLLGYRKEEESSNI